MSYKKAVKATESMLDSCSSQYSLKENAGFCSTESKSKAYAAAMKALQDKLLSVESENSELKSQLKRSDQRSQAERQNFELRLLEDRQNVDQSQISLKSRINELELSEKALRKTASKQEDLIKFLETKAKYNEDLSIRTQEQTALDKENLLLEVQCLKKTVTELKRLESDAQKTIEKTQREKCLLKEEIAQHIILNKSLKEEIELLRSTNEIQRTRIEEGFKSIKSELIVKNQENLQLIKQLNIKNKGLQQQISDSKRQSDYFKSQYTKLSRRPHGSQDMTFEHRRPKSRASESKSRNRNSTPSLRSCDSGLNSISGVSDDCSYSKAILGAEHEVRKLSEKYQEIQEARMDTGEIDNYRRSLEDICVDMEKKNKELTDLKKKQYEVLRVKLIR